MNVVIFPHGSLIGNCNATGQRSADGRTYGAAPSLPAGPLRPRS